MKDIQLGTYEARFADLIWQKAPLSSSELVKAAEREFSWKRTTTHTVLRRLCDKGLFENEHGTVSALISREDFYADKSRAFVEQSFGGSLPAFLAAFTRGRKLSEKEADELHRMIDASGKEEDD